MGTIYIMESTIRNNSKYTNLEGKTNDDGMALYAKYEWSQGINGETLDMVATLFCPSKHSFYSDLRKWRITGTSRKNPKKDFEFTMETNDVVALSILDSGEIWAIRDSGSYRLWKGQ